MWKPRIANEVAHKKARELLASVADDVTPEQYTSMYQMYVANTHEALAEYARRVEEEEARVRPLNRPNAIN
jgi:ubiquinone biosynthesis protein UbiJ